MADSQDIEAKLAAYVDGELPPEQRAEIEKYLSANPQQRRLIADLMRQRDVLRDLPKIQAPSDVAEGLNSQLERSVLLDGGERDGVAGTISPWRSVAAVAAAVLLVSALGLTIYSLLPSPTRKPPDLASMQTVPSSRPRGDSGFENEATPTSTPAPSEQELRARSAFARNTDASVRSEVAPMPEPPTAIGGGAMPTNAAVEAPMALAAKPEALTNAPTTVPSILPASVGPTLATNSRVETIDIATADATATRRQLANTLSALGGKVEASTTEPSESDGTSDNTLAVEVPPADMDRAIAVARSFSTAIPAAPPIAKSISLEPATQPMADLNSNLSQMQNQQIAQPIGEQDLLATPATQPSQNVTVRLTLLLPEVAPATAPATIPATEPTSIPSSQPTTQP